MMTNHHHTTNLSNCGNELLKCIEDLKRKRDEISKQIMVENEEKEKVQRGIAALTEKLQKLTNHTVLSCLQQQKTKEKEEKAKRFRSLKTSHMTQNACVCTSPASTERNTQAKEEYDKTIQDTEAAYMKIIESSQTLLHVLRRESMSLAKKSSLE
ncbi:sjoegren syndrome nuclear autoantigen 1 family protein [Cystoisospora suis]|uniref:Sjoegren syndrome nuclear autoantigen 1 family protein n=1 Tax=Cystoisospora suis TaxID=483139 RepID=A0A2C6KJF0_9APIC|nr:sjoegren syndrome nuclear autoantigen 1 family protein [Cystoisospora suis]